MDIKKEYFIGSGKYNILYNSKTKKTVGNVTSAKQLSKIIKFFNKKEGKSNSENINEILKDNGWKILSNDKKEDIMSVLKNKKETKKRRILSEWRKEAKKFGIKYIGVKKEDVLKEIEKAKAEKKGKNAERHTENKKKRYDNMLKRLKGTGKYDNIEEQMVRMPFKARYEYVNHLYIKSKRYKGLSQKQIEEDLKRDGSRKAKNFGWRFSDHRYGTTSNNDIGEKLPEEVIKKYRYKVPTTHQIASFKFANEKQRKEMFGGAFPYYKADLRSGDILRHTRHAHLRYKEGGIILSKYLSYDELKDFLGIDKITQSSYAISDGFVAKKVPVYPLFKITRITHKMGKGGKVLDFEIVKTNKDWKQAIKDGYTYLISGINHDEVGNGYVACTKDNYKDVFKELTGFPYIDNDGTHGIVSPIEETFGHENLFYND